MHQNIAEQLWRLLDDIDTLGDSMKPEQSAYFERVNAIAAKRHELLKTDGQKLYWPYGQVPCTITGHDETRELVPQRDEEGTVVNYAPVPNSERVKLHLTLPDGHVLHVPVPVQDFDQHVIPMLDRTGDAFPVKTELADILKTDTL